MVLAKSSIQVAFTRGKEGGPGQQHPDDAAAAEPLTVPVKR